MVVAFPFQAKFKCPLFVLKCILGGSITISVTVMGVYVVFIAKKALPNSHSFCSPFVGPTDSITEVRLLTSIVAFIPLATFSAMCLLYSYLLKYLNKDNFAQGGKLSYSIIIQLLIVTISHFITWFSSSLVFLYCVFVPRYSLSLPIWATATMLPINCIINPIILNVSCGKRNKSVNSSIILM